MKINSTHVTADPDSDPTGTLNRDKFILFRLYTYAYSQEEMADITGLPLGTVKLWIAEILDKVEDLSVQRGKGDKRYSTHLAYMQGIFTNDNVHLPKPDEQYRNIIVNRKKNSEDAC